MKHLFTILVCIFFISNITAQDNPTIKKNVISINLPFYSLVDYERQITSIKHTNINASAGVTLVPIYSDVAAAYNFGVNVVTRNHKRLHAELGLNYTTFGSDLLESLYGS